MLFERPKDRSLETGIMGAIIGSAVASITVMLWDQKKRKNLVDSLSSRLEDMKTRAKDGIEHFRNSAEEEIEEVKRKVPAKKVRRIARSARKAA